MRTPSVFWDAQCTSEVLFKLVLVCFMFSKVKVLKIRHGVKFVLQNTALCLHSGLLSV